MDDLPSRLAADLILFAAFASFMPWYFGQWRQVLRTRSARRRRSVKFRLVEASDAPSATPRPRLR